VRARARIRSRRRFLPFSFYCYLFIFSILLLAYRPDVPVGRVEPFWREWRGIQESCGLGRAADGKEGTVLHCNEGRGGGGMAADRTGLCERGGGGVRKVGLLSWKGHPVDAPDTSRSRCGMDSNKKGQ